VVVVLVIAAICVVALGVATAIPVVRGWMHDPEVAPDRPISFGYRTAWLAIETTDTEAVIAALELSSIQVVNWRTGMSTIYDDELGDHYVFVSPPVAGWTYVVGMALPHPVSLRFVDRCTPMLLDLSAQFGKVQYYFTYPVIDLYAWAKLEDGQLKRAFAWGDEGAIWNKGAVTPQERDLGLKVFELRKLGGSIRAADLDDDTGYPTESHVLKLADSWGVDPTQIEKLSGEPGYGRIGEVPAQWRVKRARRHPKLSAANSNRRPPHLHAV